MQRQRLPESPVQSALIVHAIPALEQPGECRHEPGRAEPALRAVVVNHRLLDRAKATLRHQPLDRDDMRAIKLDERLKARDDRPIADRSAVRRPD